MSANANNPAVIAVLEEIATWKSRADDEFSGSMAEVDQDEDAARRAIEEAQRQLLALATLRAELRERQSEVAMEAERRERAALREGLSTDRTVIEARAAALEAAIQVREAALAKQLEDPEVAAALDEYEKFVEVEAQLGSLPASYRRAILDHHERVRRRLEPVIAASNAGPPPLGLEPVGVGVLFAVDPIEGTPEALVAVLPVPFAVCRDWAERKEDLASLFAYRVVAAVSRLLAAVGAGTAPIQYTELAGCLAVQVWLGDCALTGDLHERALEEIDALREEADELSAAGIELYGLWVRATMLADEEG
ncbi:MAG: hypothetical protein EXR71_01735 [Myxococcales bacterium]|nr:hypothetical protein [Myxococcales bacterium]